MRRKHTPHPRSRIERAIQIRKHQKQLGSTIIAIDTAFKRLNFLVDRNIEACGPASSGSIVGSVVQVPQSDPAHEQAFDRLDQIRATLEGLIREVS
jgi:hypothetical protein